MDARVWNSESDGQHPDADVQRQLWADTDVKLRAMVRRGVRRNITTSPPWETEGIYSMNLTIYKELRAGAGDEYAGMMITAQPTSTFFYGTLMSVC